MTDAVVIGAGHNGLVAGCLLADAGWDVEVVEAMPHPGGAVRSDRSLHPDFVTDLFSAFYPLAVASPILASLDLERHGLHWTHAPEVLAHVLPDDRVATLSRNLDTTAASLDAFAAGDGAAWRAMFEQYCAIREPLIRALFRPFPPVRPGVALLRRLGAADALRFARFAVTPVRRAGDERFAGEGATLLLAGNALHTDLPPEGAGSALFGWLLAMVGQDIGFPVPVGGSGMIIEALVSRLAAAGGRLRLDAPVERIIVEGGAARGVRLASGEMIRAGRAVLADVGAPELYRDLVGFANLPPRVESDLRSFQWDAPTLKVNWALSGPIPWIAAEVGGSGTVHLGVDLDGLTNYAASLATKQIPQQPFLLLGQMTAADPTRSPPDTESAWAYTHLPDKRPLSEAEIVAHVERMQRTIERHAPGFGDRVIARSVQSPLDLQAANPNLVGGAVNGGTAAIYQQLVFRPLPGLARSETPVDRLYLAGASAHPGGGVHGGPGANAARAALARDRVVGRVRNAGTRALLRRIYR
ncbi:MAG: NAD(P)/FAD-dependent oxidoreductase [Actinomycetota bacterium]